MRRELRLAEARADRPSGEDLAKRAIEAGKAEENDRRSGLGVQETAATAKLPPMPFKVLNAPPPEADRFVADTPPVDLAPKGSLDPTPKAEAQTKSKAAAGAPPATSKTATAEKPQSAPTAEKPQFKVASAAGAAKPLVEAAPQPAAGQKCRVWTASYGGQKALIIRSVIDRVVNYTVLDVNEGAEKREADAFISAYAKEGAIAGEYGSQAQALDKAFELCPEG